ncbi:MAG: AIPR family protein [Methanophagales archaeon]|nr:AIPR family protein [Methanophagales archaeon]
MVTNYPSSALWKAFQSREDLKSFGNDALLLFALQLKLPIEDIISVASTSLTDGKDDKKADLIYIDTEQGISIIAQSYFSEDFTKKEAKANKASDLNTAVSWLLIRPINELPLPLQSHAQELREAISNEEINRLYIWYVHNLSESDNVKTELQQVEHTTKAIIKSGFRVFDAIEIHALEIGANTLTEWYKAISTPILVSEQYNIEISGGYEIKQANWKAFVTTISGKWLSEQYNKYGTKFFSANVRDYLGSRKSDKNINEGIKATAKDLPDNFWVFNNGITILTNDFSALKDKGKNILQIQGASVINGAQTTGALGHLDSTPSDEIKVQARFVVCSDTKTVQDIVNYNNSQNKMTAPDFRSKDIIQERLKQEFLKIPDVEYLPRRGGNEDIIKRRPNILSSVTAGQAIAGFHRAPGVAYHKKTHIWESDSLYAKYFNDQITAKHIIVAHSLLKAIQNKKISLFRKSKTGALTELETSQLDYYRKRGSIFMMEAAIASCMEIFLDRQIPNLFKIKFKRSISPDDGVKIFEPIVNSASSFSNPLLNGLSDGFKNEKAVNDAIRTFRSLINSIKEANSKIFSTFATEIDLS